MPHNMSNTRHKTVDFTEISTVTKRQLQIYDSLNLNCFINDFPYGLSVHAHQILLYVLKLIVLMIGTETVSTVQQSWKHVEHT